MERNKAVGLGLFPFNALVGEDFAQYFPTLPIVICLPFDTIDPASAVSFGREYPDSFMQTNQQKKTKTYGLVRLGAPFRQGRSLWLPTLPYQRTNRYAVVSAKQAAIDLWLKCLAWRVRHLKDQRLRGSYRKTSRNSAVTINALAWTSSPQKDKG